MLYPFNSAIILEDNLFITYGGHTGSSVAAQRQAAYLMAEMQLSEDLGTYLLPTIVTGTYQIEQMGRFLNLDHAYVNQVYTVSFIDNEEKTFWSVTGTNNIYVDMRSKDWGLIDIPYLWGNCSQCGGHLWPYQIQVVYNTGFSSGTSYHPDILLALTTYAEIVLNEIAGYGNESTGDVGEQQRQTTISEVVSFGGTRYN